MEGTPPPSESSTGQVGPSPAPGSGHAATETRLGRIAIIVIIVIGLLWLGSWIAWTILAPDIEIHYHDHPGRHHHDLPGGGGRLTALPAPTVT